MQFVLQEEIKISFCQTYVIQVQPNDYERVAKWARAQLEIKLIGAYAHVFLENKFHVLVTFTSAFKKEFRYQKIQEELKIQPRSKNQNIPTYKTAPTKFRIGRREKRHTAAPSRS